LLHAGSHDDFELCSFPLPDAPLPDAPLEVFASPLADAPLGALHPLSAVPQLSSFPEAAAKLYLDFDGFYEPVWGAYSNITTPPLDDDGDTSTFSDAELAKIEQVWRQVAEDFAPFNIDVTTILPASFADRVGMRVAIGGDGNWYGSAGGVGYVNSYTNPGLTNTVYVFSDNLLSSKSIAEASSHEAGHGYGLDHQSQYNASGGKIAEYYSGPGDGRAPIMGNSYSAARGLWWYGTSAASSTTFQDDLSRLTRSANAFGYRADDHGNSPAAASSLMATSGGLTNQGIITTTADRDYFAFDTGAGNISLSVTVPIGINNLDAVLELRDANDVLIASSDPAGQFTASINATVAAGSYRAVVASHGSYGDIGTYTITVNAVSPALAGTVYADLDRDGTRGAGEPGLAGARVFDDRNGNGLWEAQEPSTVTNSDGGYYLPFAQAGSHNLRLQPLPNYLPTGGAYVVSTVSGVTLGNLDFGNFASSIAGRVFRDTNLNGLDDGEAGLGGITVYDDLNGSGARDLFATTASYGANDVPRAITDYATTTSEIVVSDLTAPLVDVNVRLNLTHSYDGDLAISLRAPDGTIVRLTNRHGASGDNFSNTLFDDEAATPISAGSAPFSGSYRPFEPLAALDGKNGNGTWQLLVFDLAGGDTGILTGWALELFRNELEPATTTQPDGSYLLANVTQGTHLVRPVVPGGGYQTSPGGGAHHVLVAGYTDAANRDFGLVLPGVAHRAVFYNNSAYDGFSAAVNAADDAAIAIDKTAYLPGSGLATAANVTSYSRGINGLMIDLPGSLAPLSAADFRFKTGTTADPASWVDAPAPSAVVTRAGAGLGGTSRVEITWPDGAIQNTWLEVTVRGNDALGGFHANTGLAASDVFYFGNRIGDDFTGSPPLFFVTNADDEIAARLHGGFAVGIANTLDFNRDNLVNASDQIVARLSTGLLVRLNLGPLGAPLAAYAEKPAQSGAVASGLAARASVRDAAPGSVPEVLAAPAPSGLVTAQHGALPDTTAWYAARQAVKVRGDVLMDDAIEGLVDELFDA